MDPIPQKRPPPSRSPPPSQPTTTTSPSKGKGNTHASTNTQPQTGTGTGNGNGNGHEYAQASGKGKFRFKSSSRHRSRHFPDTDKNHAHSRSQNDARKRHKHTHRERDRDRDRDNPEQPTTTTTNNQPHRKRAHQPSSPGPPPLSPDTAFRESLFDALGDDEGAAFWESVYGQPIHTYAFPGGSGERDAGLEQMTEEEYACYVRSQMWKRTREGMLAEQERVRTERAQQKRKRQSEDEERVRFERAMEESLARGRERRRAKAWRAVWGEYLGSWERVDSAAAAAAAAAAEKSHGGGSGKSRLGGMLFWPVESGRRRDVSGENVEEFMRCAPASSAGEADADLLATLKTERVRWHPDKIQHRYGTLGVDASVMRSVTEVFQIIDRLWNERKK
ncbi:hypothetical protein ARAM_006105 [Aspergillus rambellii]|uniref:J domain-containing protein n=1 Tax=Aspergillus rambellii TaxID=308745 RepID=A0A0F8W393_9EURO|nr:hypothetical protein ARAM_006105 [Aspergillus rambellii]